MKVSWKLLSPIYHGKSKRNNAWFQTTNQPVALLPTKSLRVHQEKPWRESTTLRYPRKNRRNTRAHSAPFWNLWVACPPMPEKIVFHHVTRLHWCLTWRLPSCLRLASGLSLYFPTTVMELFVFWLYATICSAGPLMLQCSASWLQQQNICNA